MSTGGKLTFEEISKLQERKVELKTAHKDYVGRHPEIKTLLSDFTAAILLEKPEDVYSFARQHFEGLAHAKK